MKDQAYKKQVALLLDVLPEVAKEKSFALHGGTAINLFVRDMPRLSVDIDLTYLPIEDRETTLKNIAASLENIKANIETRLPNIRVQHKEENGKLLISNQSAQIKIEVNLVARGTITPPIIMQLCAKAQEEFDAFATMQIVPLSQLYGGKICAALDRQHPRDLFDIKSLLENEGINEEIKTGFLYCLLASDRPFNEILRPTLKDQAVTLQNHFTGMSADEFNYADFEIARDQLITTITQSLTDVDKKFLLSIINTEPDWSNYNFEAFPSVQWKLLNLRKLKTSNPNKHEDYISDVKSMFGNRPQ